MKKGLLEGQKWFIGYICFQQQGTSQVSPVRIEGKGQKATNLQGVLLHDQALWMLSWVLVVPFLIHELWQWSPILEIPVVPGVSTVYHHLLCLPCNVGLSGPLCSFREQKSSAHCWVSDISITFQVKKLSSTQSWAWKGIGEKDRLDKYP